ncbi:Sugar phosphate isomerase/epimerase [Fictibacillus enclensis]|nr:Sugar phosphate isomerase/epimerase [Fictibacillus enclensis]
MILAPKEYKTKFTIYEFLREDIEYMSYLSLTSWSLHRHLGPLSWSKWDHDKKEIVTEVEEQPLNLKLVDLPGILSEKGFQAVEIVHAHFHSTELDYLQKLCQSIKKSGIRFYTLLIDYGDISTSDPVRREKDMDFIKSWIDVASIAGAENVRVVSGESSPEDIVALQRASVQFTELCVYAKKKGVGVLTENFRSLASTSENCLYLLEHTDLTGLISDFGNFSGPNKLDSLKETLPKSKSVHVKALTTQDGEVDKEELENCLALLRDADYSGPLTLVYDEPGDVWKGINKVKDIVKKHI